MSQAIKDLKDFLTKSPSVVFPDEVLEYVDVIEEENEKLREIATHMKDNLLSNCSECWWGNNPETCDYTQCDSYKMYKTLCELGIEVE